jgi:hypothetical protein
MEALTFEVSAQLANARESGAAAAMSAATLAWPVLGSSVGVTPVRSRGRVVERQILVKHLGGRSLLDVVRESAQVESLNAPGFAETLAPRYATALSGSSLP